MYLHAKPTKPFIPWEWGLALLPSILSTQVFGFTPLSFEDHAVTLACMHILWWVFIPMRYATPKPCKISSFVPYGLGWLAAFSLSQCITALIIGHCGWSNGLTWMALLVWPSGLFLLGLLYTICLRTSSALWSRMVLILILLGFCIPNLLDFFQTPTMWAYHFSAGYIPGPLFDAWIPRWNTLFLFRLWTIAMALFFFINARRFRAWTILLCIPFLFRTELGFRSTHASVQEALGRIQHSQYAKIITNQDLRLPLSRIELASVDEWIQHLSQSLHVPLPKTPIQIYVYEDPILKKKLTGTHWTMIGNPMQNSLHLLYFSASDSLLPHELSHVISKPLGIPILGTGRNLAMTEGLAMAMQQEYGFLPMDQWAAYMLSQDSLPAMTSLFSNISFFKNNATRSYNAAGSFIQWLLTNRPADSFSMFYATNNAQKAYNQTLSSLENQWHQYLQAIKIDPMLIEKMKPALNRPPVYLQKCAHALAALKFSYKHECKNPSCKNKVIDQALTCSPDHPWPIKHRVEQLLQQPEKNATKLASWLTHPALPSTLKNPIRHALSMNWKNHATPTEQWLWDQNPQWLEWYWRGLYDFIDQMSVTPPHEVSWSLTQVLSSKRHAPQLYHIANQLPWYTGTPIQQTQLHRKMLRRFEYLGQPQEALQWLIDRPTSSAIGQAWYVAQVRRLTFLQQTFPKKTANPMQTTPPQP